MEAVGGIRFLRAGVIDGCEHTMGSGKQPHNPRVCLTSEPCLACLLRFSRSHGSVSRRAFGGNVTKSEVLCVQVRKKNSRKKNFT